MGIALGVQADHSKSYTINIKVPNPIVTFSNFSSDDNFFRDLQKDIQYVTSVSSLDELPSDYRIILQKLFTFLEHRQSIKRENILKYVLVAESKDILNQLSHLEIHTATLIKSFEIVMRDGILDENVEAATEGFTSCQEILRYLSDENGIFFQKYFISTPCLVTYAGIYQSFVKLCRREDLVEEMALLRTTAQKFKDKCIQERLDNIKMLRTQSESYNLHDYSYEAQIRKDVSFGGKINDFYDKRPINKITFRDHPLNEASDADLILAAFKNEITREYELFFETIL